MFLHGRGVRELNYFNFPHIKNKKMYFTNRKEKLFEININYFLKRAAEFILIMFKNSVFRLFARALSIKSLCRNREKTKNLSP